MDGDDLTTRAALGRMVFVGDLYDARTDNPCGISVFTRAIPLAAITVDEYDFSEVQLLRGNSISEKFQKLGVESEQQASILSGLCFPEGSGSFLEEKRTAASSSLIYKLITRDESVNLFCEELEGSLDIKDINSGAATHIITSVSWGTYLIVSCRAENYDKKDEKDVETQLCGQMEALSLSLSGKGSPPNFSEDPHYSVKCFADVLPPSPGELPRTLEGALQLIRQLPTLVASSSNGKGMPVTLQLTPISLLQSCLNLDIHADITFLPLEEVTRGQVIALLEYILETIVELEDLHQFASSHKQIIRPEDRIKIVNLKRQMTFEEASYRAKLPPILEQVRGGRMSGAELQKIIQQFQVSRISPQNTKPFIEKLGGIRKIAIGGGPPVPAPAPIEKVSESLPPENGAGARAPASTPEGPSPDPAKPPRKASKEINILILGETGVGKSTWINGFINFYKHGTFQEAEKGQLLNLIPTHFTVCDENFVQVTVSTGTDQNEVSLTGQSATQEARVYSFPIGPMTVRLIDTPGIGDTRGSEQDGENFQNILSTLSNLEEIHGICILLKPNNARLTVMFRYCIKELLTYLHRDASKNIVFCFTNSRGTLYRPGDTMPALITLLKENKDVEIPVNKDTVYCFDSEAYRFLAAVKNSPPVQFSEDDRDNFVRSWDRSFTELKKMLEYIARQPPHPIQSTLNLNSSRELILKMCRPLAEISRYIQLNKGIIEEDRLEIANMKDSLEDLQKKTMTTRAVIEMIKLDYPKTVCGHPKCTRFVSAEGVQKVEYVTVCHPRCHQTGVPADTVGDSKLLKCSRMSRLTARCTHCNHHYMLHLHIYYDSILVTSQVENESVRESLQANLSATEMKLKMIEEKDAWLEEYEYELSMIEKASIRFAHFLKENAITPYNDGMESYLNHLIREEENKVALGGNRKTLESLRQSRSSYVQQKAILEEQMTRGVGTVPTTEEMNMLVRELIGLKHSGKTLQEALDCVNHAGSMEYQQSVMQPVTHQAPAMPRDGVQEWVV